MHSWTRLVAWLKLVEWHFHFYIEFFFFQLYWNRQAFQFIINFSIFDRDMGTEIYPILSDSRRTTMRAQWEPWTDYISFRKHEVIYCSHLTAAAAKSLQSCRTLCDPIDGSPPGSPVPGIFQQEHWSRLHFLLQCMKVKSLSRVWLLATPWTAVYQASLSMGFSRQEYWSGVPSPFLT